MNKVLRVTERMNSVWWGKHISLEVEKTYCKSLVESVLCYQSEVWRLNVVAKGRINAVKILEMSAGFRDC